MPNLRIEARLNERRLEAESARALGRMRAAAAAYATALELLNPEADKQLAIELRLARAECLHASGDYKAELEEVQTLSTIAEGLDDANLRIVAALREATIYGLRGELALGELIATEALDQARRRGSSDLEARALLVLAELSYSRSRLDEADANALLALALAEQGGDQRSEAHALRLRGLVALHGKQPAAAQSHLHGSLALCRALGDQAGEALALNAIGTAANDHAQSRNAYLQAMAIVETLGDGEIETTVANNLGVIYGTLGLYGQAQRYATRAVAQARASSTIPLLVISLETLGRALTGLGQYSRARSAMQEGYSLAALTGSPQSSALCLVGLARLDLLEHAPARAAVGLNNAAAIFATIGALAEQATALALLAAAALAEGHLDRAGQHTAAATAFLAAGYHSTEFATQEVWWWRYQALLATEGAHSPAAQAALEHAWEEVAGAIGTLSDPGLRRAFLGHVPINRAILEELARIQHGAPSAPAQSGERTGLQDQLARLLGVAARLNETHNAGLLREMLLDELAELTGAERLMVILGADLEQPEQVLCRGAQAEALDKLRCVVGPLCREALRRRRAMLWPELETTGLPAPSPLGPRSALTAPLITGAQVLGVIYADVSAALGPLAGGDLELVGLLLAQAATALENARLYEQVRRDKTELERLVATRTADLQKANRALERQAAEAQAARASAEAASASKTIFLANVSHELRTPLNAVIGFAQLLSRDQSLGERHRELASLIDRSGVHLLTLIHDVIELSKLEAGRLTVNPAPFELRALIDDLVGLFQLRAETQGLRLSATVDAASPRFLLGDEGRLRQVLINLIGNALKFTHSGVVSVQAAAYPEGDHVRLTFLVSDTGIGIDADELAEIFQPYAQSRTGRHAREGSGLGLALSRQLARLMGGDIRVSSLPGVGSSFSCEVLVDAATEPPAPHREQRLIGLTTSGRRYRVLVADDSWQRRRLLAEWLVTSGLEVREAVDGPQALELWARWRPHVALIAEELQGVDGAEVARRIKDSPAGRATVLIALSSAQRASAYPGFDSALESPVTFERLLELLAQQLGLGLRYTMPEPVSPAVLPLRPVDLATLPATTREQLIQASADSDPAAVADALAALREQFPELAARLAVLAAEFQFELIEGLLQAAKTSERQ